VGLSELFLSVLVFAFVPVAATAGELVLKFVSPAAQLWVVPVEAKFWEVPVPPFTQFICRLAAIAS